MGAEEVHRGKSEATLHDHIGGSDEAPLQDHVGEVMGEKAVAAAEEGLSWPAKFGLAGVLLAICYGWMRLHSSSSRSMRAGMHGAYPERSSSLA